MKFRTLGLLAAAVAGFAMASSAKAASMLSLWDGTTLVTVNDNLAGDSNGAVGGINWAGTIGIWNVTVSSGITKPGLGALSPAADLSIQATSTAGGTLVVAFGDTGYGPYSGAMGSTLAVNNVNETQTYKLYSNGNLVGLANDGGTGTLLTTVGPLSGLAIGSAIGSTGGLTSPYALTIYNTIVAGGAGTSRNSSDAAFAAAPVPAAAWMGMSTLAGLSGMGVLRKRARKA